MGGGVQRASDADVGATTAIEVPTVGGMLHKIDRTALVPAQGWGMSSLSLQILVLGWSQTIQLLLQITAAFPSGTRLSVGSRGICEGSKSSPL